MADRDITLRLAVTNAEKAIRDLQQFGDKGENALKRLGSASQPATAGLTAVNAAAVTATRGLSIFQAAAAGLAGGLLLYLNPITAIAGALTLGVRASESAERSFLRLEGVLKATGGAAGLTADEIARFAEDLERSTLATSDQITEAAAALASFNKVSGAAFTDTIKLAQDLAATFGGNLVSRTTQLGKALQDPVRGLSQLREAGVVFTASQEDLVRSLVETGDEAAAINVILGELQAQVGGAGTAEAGGLSGAFSRAAAASGDFFQSLAENSGLTDFFIGQFNELADGLDRLGGRAAGVTPLQSQLATAQAELDEARRAVESPGAFAALAGLEDEKRRVAELTQEVFNLQSAIIQETRARGEARKVAEEQRTEREAEAEFASREAKLKEVGADLTKRVAAEDKKAAAAAAALAKQRADAISKVAIEVDQQSRLADALGESVKAYDAVSKEIEVENALREVGLSLKSAEGRELAELVRQRQAEAEAIDSARAAREREAAALEQQRRATGDRGFDPAASARDYAAFEDERQRALERRQEQAAQRQAAVLDDAVSRVAALTSSTIADFRNGMLDSADDFGQRLGDVFASIPEQLAGTAFTSLFDGLISDFSEALKSSTGPGGELDFTALLGAFNNPLGAAALGASLGGIAAEVGGFNSPFASLGGGIGAGAGFIAGNAIAPGIGGILGGSLGGLLGSFVGGSFGGSERNNQGFKVRLDRDQVELIGNRNENTDSARQVGEQLLAVANSLEALGVEFSVRRLRLNVNNKRSPEEAFARGIQGLANAAGSDDPTLSTILNNTRARTADALLADVGFARIFDQLTQSLGPAELALRDLVEQFEQASDTARRLGLDEVALAKVRDEAIDDLVRSTEDQIRAQADSIRGVFESRLSPLLGALDGFQFGAGSALGVQEQLGLARSEFDALAGRAAGGEAVDFNRLASLGTQVVGLARELDASGAIFQQTFADVDSVIRDVIDQQGQRQEDLLAALPDALREAQTDQTVALSERLDQLITEFSQLTRAVELQGRVA